MLAVLPRDRTLSLWKVCSQHKPTLLNELTATLVRDACPVSSFFSCINKQISHLHQLLASSTKQLPSKEPTRSSCMQLSSIQRFTKGTLARPRSFVPALLHPTQTQPSPRRRGLRTAQPDGLTGVFWLSPTFGFVALTGYPTHRKLNTAKLHLILCGSL